MAFRSWSSSGSRAAYTASARYPRRDDNTGRVPLATNRLPSTSRPIRRPEAAPEFSWNIPQEGEILLRVRLPVAQPSGNYTLRSADRKHQAFAWTRRWRPRDCVLMNLNRANLRTSNREREPE